MIVPTAGVRNLLMAGPTVAGAVGGLTIGGITLAATDAGELGISGEEFSEASTKSVKFAGAMLALGVLGTTIGGFVGFGNGAKQMASMLAAPIVGATGAVTAGQLGYQLLA